MSRSDFEGLRQFDNLIFDVHNLDSALFHLKDIEQFESEHPELFSKAPSAQSPKRIAELETQLAQARQENERLTQEIERLKAGTNENDMPAPRTAPANEARAQTTAGRWAGRLQQAVSLAVECAQAGKACSYLQHEQMWETRFGSRPAREALRAMRRGLPDDLVDGDRDPPAVSLEPA
ncbi:hypothetical protein JCM15519_26050 [Fundidesulfovibrio butyratiphilus]